MRRYPASPTTLPGTTFSNKNAAVLGAKKTSVRKRIIVVTAALCALILFVLVFVSIATDPVYRCWVVRTWARAFDSGGRLVTVTVSNGDESSELFAAARQHVVLPHTAHQLDRSLWTAAAKARFEHHYQQKLQQQAQQQHQQLQQQGSKTRENVEAAGQRYLFELDRPRFDDEADFFHDPKSAGGDIGDEPPTAERIAKLLRKVSAPASSSSATTNAQQQQQQQQQLLVKTATALHAIFAEFDKDERSPTTMPVYGTMCIGVDCGFIPRMISRLRIGIGHFLVVVSTDDAKHVAFFKVLHALFPGRFTAFVRPERLSCAESWNLVTRIGFAGIRPMPAQIFIANADWAPGIDSAKVAEVNEDAESSPSSSSSSSSSFDRNFKLSKQTIDAARRVSNHMAAFARWSRTQIHHRGGGGGRRSRVIAVYNHFSAFSFTAFGYRELGYFDEVLFPALTEDVEFHIKATSKGLGAFEMYEHGLAASIHQVRGSVGEKKVDERYARVARKNYIWQKWNVDVDATFTDGKPHYPWKCPWNNCAQFSHNSSWAVDPVHRRCAMTGVGPRFNYRRECWFDARVLRDIARNQEDVVDGDGRRSNKKKLLLPARALSKELVFHN